MRAQLGPQFSLDEYPSEGKNAGYVGVARRVASIDSFIPLGPAAHHVLVSEESILDGARGLLAR